MNHYSDTKTDAEFGQGLLKKELIATESVNAALKASRNSTKSLLEIIAEDYGVDENALYEALTESTGLNYQDLKTVSFDKAVVSRIPIKIASHYGFMPLKLQGERLIVAVDYPFNMQTLDDIRLQTGFSVQQMLSKREDILEALKKNYGFAADTVEKIVRKATPVTAQADAEMQSMEQIDKMAEGASVINLVNEIFLDAVQKRATDIHFEPYRGEFRLRYRIDGVLQDTNLSQNAKHLIQPVLSRIKIMANLDIVERRLPQDGRATVKVKDQSLDLRISSIPTRYGESIVVRILPTEMIFDLAKLGLDEKNVALLETLVQKPNGIVLLTGPTGSGKTTTLYACLNKMNSKERKIITIEDPVEYEIPGITQIQIQPKVGLDFAKGLRSMLRHDPDVMMVGEIRDFETAEIAIRAALTGHLVFSTLHTNDAASGVTRLLDIGLEPFLVASSVQAIVAQRLVRRICPKCKTEDTSQPTVLKTKIAKDLGLKTPIKVYKGKGCDACNQTGFYGRTGIHEVLAVSDKVKELIVNKSSSHEIKQRAMQDGMLTLLQDGWKKVIAGVTTPAEVINVTNMEKEPEDSVSEAPATEEVPEEGVRYSDQRLFPRIQSQIGVTYRRIEIHYRVFKKDAPVQGPERVGFTENISASGFLIRLPEIFALSTILDMNFEVPEKAGRTIQCLGRVVRVEEDDAGFLAGVMFLDLTPADRAHLYEFVRKKQSVREAPNA